MTIDELEDLLRRWGRVYGEAPPPEWDDGRDEVAYVAVGGGAHPLAIAMDYAPGRHQRMVSVAYARPREALKFWRDPTPCIESRHYAGALYFSGAEVGRVAPDVSRVERAAMDLYRINTLRGIVLRAQYCRRGDQASKVDWINGLGRAMDVKLRTYRDELAHARTWVHARLSE